MWSQLNHMIFVIIWSWKQRYTCMHDVWGEKYSHTSWFPTLSSCDASPLLTRIPFWLCLMLVTLLTSFPLLLISTLPPYPDFALRSVLSFRSLLEVIHPSFLLPMSIMPSIWSLLAKQKTWSRSPKLCPISLTNPSFQTQFISTWKSLAWRLWSSKNAPFSLPSITRHVWTLPMLTRIGL